MANQQLIKGAYMGPQNAGIANYYLNSQRAKAGKPGKNYGYNYPSIPYKQMQNFLNTNQTNYIDNLPAGYEVEKLPSSMRQGVTNWSKSMQIEAGNYARLMKSPGMKAGSTAWIEANAGLQTIKNQFKNISSNLDNFKALKTEFLEDFDNKTISEGSDTDQLKMLFSTDHFNYQLRPGSGEIQYNLPDGSVVSGNNLPKYFNKNSDGANKLIDLNEKAYKGATQWDSPTRDHYTRQVKNIVREKGREGLLSLATDDFLDEPLITKDSPNSFLLLEENHEALEQFVIDNYVQGMESASATAYSNNRRKTSTSSSATSSGPLVTQDVSDKFWAGGNLNEITNSSGWDPKYQVVESDKDGAFDILYNPDPFNPYGRSTEIYIKKNLDPSIPEHKKWWDEVMLGGSMNLGSSIDQNQL